jgi:prolyl 4-hydroxylase
MQSSLSLLSLLQYALFALVAYVLAGAPLLTLLSGGAAGDARDAIRGVNASTVLERLAIPVPGLECPEHKFKGVHVLRTEPLVVYIEGFLSKAEGREIVDVRYVD